MKCRFCNSHLDVVFADLVNSPPSNSFLEENQLNEPEVFYPLKTFVCTDCKLVQVDEYKKSDDIFNSNYVYFSSFSKSWLEHAKKYVEIISERLKLDGSSFVTEIASNDGYLLQYFKGKNIPCVGIEPTSSTASVARKKGIEVIEDFFDSELASSLKKSDLILGNNVLAHVPDINDFVRALKLALKDEGTITMEFPHLINLIKYNQFDTIYHEHFSYLSLYTVKRIFETHGLKLYDVEELTTHGGSLRIYATHSDNDFHIVSDNVSSVLENEYEFGVLDIEMYKEFQKKADKVKYDLISFLLKAKKEGKKVAAYGAAAKGNTLLNYAGIKSDLIDFVVDKSPYKQGLYLPGSHIPVVDEAKVTLIKPDFILILPWNIKDEIIKQLEYARRWNVSFVFFVPHLEIL